MPPQQLDARVVFLTHYIPLYQVRVLQTIAAAVSDFHVLLSTPIEPNRAFAPDRSGLDVDVQNTLTLRRRWRHPEGQFEDPLYVHVPYDTRSRLHRLQPDVVMSLELGARSLAAARHCRRHPNSRLILCTYMSERTEQGRGWIRALARRRLIEQADAITHNGPSCRDYLRSRGADEERLFHLPYAADDRTLYRGPVERDECYLRGRLLCVGQLSQRKGVFPLLEQLSRYCHHRPNRRLHLSLAGDGPLRTRIEHYPRPANLTIELLGNVTPDRLAVLIAEHGALIAPTLADEWMLVVDEALHAGLPVIGSVHAQAVTALVRGGVNGWRYDPTRPHSLNRVLDQYLAEPATRIAAMRVAARDSVAHRTPEWAAAGAIEAIRWVLDQPSRRADATPIVGRRECVMQPPSECE